MIIVRTKQSYSIDANQNFRTRNEHWFATIQHLADLTRHQRLASARRTVQQQAAHVRDAELQTQHKTKPLERSTRTDIIVSCHVPWQWRRAGRCARRMRDERWRWTRRPVRQCPSVQSPSRAAALRRPLRRPQHRPGWLPSLLLFPCWFDCCSSTRRARRSLQQSTHTHTHTHTHTLGLLTLLRCCVVGLLLGLLTTMTTLSMVVVLWTH